MRSCQGRITVGKIDAGDVGLARVMRAELVALDRTQRLLEDRAEISGRTSCQS